MPTIFSRLYASEATAYALADKLKAVGLSDTELKIIGKPDHGRISEGAVPSAMRLMQATNGPGVDDEDAESGVMDNNPAIDSSEEKKREHLTTNLRAAGIYETAAKKYAGAMPVDGAVLVVSAPYGKGKAAGVILDSRTINRCWRQIGRDVRFPCRKAKKYHPGFGARIDHFPAQRTSPRQVVGPGKAGFFR